MSEQTILGSEAPAENNAGGVLQPTENNILNSAPQPEPNEVFPEAFRVMAGDQLDVNASAAKLAEAYKARAAFGEVPANDAEYNPVDLGNGAKWEEVKELDAVKAFTEEARKLGMTHEQYAYSLKTIAAAELDGRNFAHNHNREASEADLRATWADAGDYAKNIKAAGAAVRAFIPADKQQEFSNRYGNDSEIIKLLAKIGGEISEDTPLGLSQPIPTHEDVKSLMASEAYRDSKHPEHAAVMAKVQRFYSKTYSDAQTL